MIKLLALGALLVVAAYAGSFEQRIERHTRLPKANTKGLVRPQWMTVRRQRAQRFVSGRFSSGAQPIINHYDDFYLGNISIGSPDQGPFTVVLDTSSAYLWVIDSLCQDDACEGYPSSGYDKHRFNLSASTTAEPTGELFSVEYRIGSAVGYLIEDDVDLGGLRAQNVTFGSALSISDVFGYVAVDGVLGLGWPEFSEDGVALPPLFQILDQLDAPIFTVWLDRHQKYSAAGAGGGQITYGALDAVNCDAQVDYVPLTSLDAWQFKIDYFTVGEFSLPHPAQVVSDTTSSWLGLRTDLFQGLVRETGAKYDFLQDLYTVNCDAKSLPDLVFSIGGKEYNVSSKDYLLDLDLGSNQCALAAYDIGQPGFGATSPAVILGDVFIRAYCNVYDIGGQRIGFAKAHHKEN